MHNIAVDILTTYRLIENDLHMISLQIPFILTNLICKELNFNKMTTSPDSVSVSITKIKY